MQALLFCLLRRLDDGLKHETVQWAAYYVSGPFSLLILALLRDNLLAQSK
jgi:hypothetical protein